ncbi:MAG TPA: hypothetical protein VG125_05955 [Pirellulales bacterium]|jgi:hypothetical protein|nr:hypothetical protein [Pirellulales bacterium]
MRHYIPGSVFRHAALVSSLAGLLTAWSGVAEALVIHGGGTPPVQDSGLGPSGFSEQSNVGTTPASSGPTFTEFPNGFSIAGDASVTANSTTSSLTVTLEGELGLKVNTAGEYLIGAGTDIILGSNDIFVSITNVTSSADLLYYPSEQQVGGSTANIFFGVPIPTYYPPANQVLSDYAGGARSNAFQLNTGDYTIQWVTNVTFADVKAGDTLYMGLPGGGGLDPTPEPTSFALWGLGATLIGGFTHWRRKRANSATAA